MIHCAFYYTVIYRWMFLESYPYVLDPPELQ
jgi:hypothetical protein